MAKKRTATEEHQMLVTAGYRFEMRSYTIGSGPRALRQVTQQVFSPAGELLGEAIAAPHVLRRRALAHMEGAK